ncbi:DUF924 family protein [Ancylobacter dichloromethanicus]|uniref:DUF924 domain-containing protein n=1 Tax=Ancylobacter dichloromethanicus TaxID=518825 RepID=A0A9W6N0V2_9HYPH|nr:DUF924 family protein [Ancylobacter dichloromethanicus]MBS7556706.1 DUF924 family protein [Ancylobacter dichloromethanicus]GLK73558.1 hypothetical protein GCM10017643_36750 [Ancylobacter dichloromethanicus]
MSLPTADEIIAFWRNAGPERWFEKDAAFDAAIRARFFPAYEAAAAGALRAWEDTAEGCYALILLLDQFPRNLFRGSRQAFATDAQARAIADAAIARGFDRAFELPERRFFYVPFMHSEELADQQRCVALCEAAGDAEGVHHAVIHRDIIRDFGRFPHRNPVLGRDTSEAEHTFLKDGGFAG